MRKEVMSITMMCSPVVRVCPSLLWAWGQNTAVPSSHGHSVLQWKRACLVPVVALPGPPLVPPLGLPRCPLVWPEKAAEPLQPIYTNIINNSIGILHMMTPTTSTMITLASQWGKWAFSALSSSPVCPLWKWDHLGKDRRTEGWQRKRQGHQSAPRNLFSLCPVLPALPPTSSRRENNRYPSISLKTVLIKLPHARLVILDLDYFPLSLENLYLNYKKTNKICYM